jgi:hypothetical protein
MLTTQLFDIAASGLVPPDVIARLAGLSVPELMARHGGEIAAAQAETRGAALRQVLLFALQRQSSETLTTALEADEEDWQAAVSDPFERRLLRGHAVLKLAAFARGGTHGRHVGACAALLALDNDTWQAAADAAGLRLCDPCRSGLPEHNRALIRQHLEGIFQDAKTRPGLRRQAGQVLLSAPR